MHNNKRELPRVQFKHPFQVRFGYLSPSSPLLRVPGAYGDELDEDSGDEQRIC